MKVKVHLRDGATLIADDVEETSNDQVDGYVFFVATDADGDKVLVVGMDYLVAVEYIHE